MREIRERGCWPGRSKEREKKEEEKKMGVCVCVTG
jgi:hypothetical protein